MAGEHNNETMTVGELIEHLLKMPRESKVRLEIANPKDTAFTNEINGVRQAKDGVVSIEGWVGCDNEGAFAPWAPEHEDDEE